LKYFIVVGERSGDFHGASLVKQLRIQDPSAEIVAWGGDMLEAKNVQLLRHYYAYSVMGFWEIISHIPKLSSLLAECKRNILRFSPDVLILIDFPGFNLRIASFAKKRGIKTAYYISPKVWAWNKSRVSTIKKSVDRMLVIFPFEKEFYQQNNYKVQYVGNPSLEYVDDFVFRQKSEVERDSIIFLPGSRKKEIEYAVPIIRQLAERVENRRIIVSQVDNVSDDLYEPLRELPNVTLSIQNSLELLSKGKVAVVTSGTATLESALMNVPQLVVYRMNPVSYWLAKRLIRIKYISLVNILTERSLVTELIQQDYNASRLKLELEKLLTDQGKQEKISEGYSEIRNILGNQKASVCAASSIIELGCS